MGGDGLEDGGPGGGGVAGVEVEGEEDVDCAGEGKGEEEEGCDEGGDVHYGGRDGWRCWGDFCSEKKAGVRSLRVLRTRAPVFPRANPSMSGELLDHFILETSLIVLPRLPSGGL